MAAVNYYEIYDIKAKGWLDGQYLSKEVQKIVGIKGNVSKYATENAVINGRYILRIAEEPNTGRTLERQ